MTALLAVAALLTSAPTFAAPGDPDVSFGGGDGKVTYTISPQLDSVEGMATQRDGRIVAVGYTVPVGGTAKLVVLRLKPDGSLDPTFGSGGAVVGPVVGGATAAVVQDDGKILLGGYGSQGMSVFRLNADGTLDQGFGSGGAAAAGLGVGTTAHAIALLSDGRILAAGDGGGADLIVARFLSNGAPDPSFGSGGTVKLTANAGMARVRAMALLPGGKIALAGWASVAAGDQVLAAVVGPDGSPDSSFGPGGIRIDPLGGIEDLGVGVIAYPPDRILVAASVANASSQHHFGWLLFGADGSIQKSRIESAGADGEPKAIAARPDGKVVLAGRYASSFAVRQYTTALAPDASFGNAGLATMHLSGAVDKAQALVVERDGRILLGGIANLGGLNGDVDFGFARLEGFGSPLLYDDFADGVMTWTPTSGTWVEFGGSLAGGATGTAVAYAPTPWAPSAENGCSGSCTILLSLAEKPKGSTARIALAAWRTSAGHQVQLIYAPSSGKWILKEFVGATVISKKVKAKISDSALHEIALSFDGFDFFASVDGRPLLRMPGIEVPFGNVGLRIRNATVSVRDVLVY